MPLTSRRTALAALAALPLPLSVLAQGQDTWPAGKPVRMVVAYPPGGVTDMVARLVGDRLSVRLGTPIPIDNRAGAAGIIGMDMVAKAPADGYTICLSSISNLTLAPHLSKVPFDPVQDITPVISLVSSPIVILATSIVPVRDFAELVARARSRPGELRWSTSGQGSLGQIMLEQVKLAAGVDIVHIPYRGSGQQMTEALGGQLEIVSTNASPALMQHIRAGRLRPLAAGASQRMALLPDVPTFAELGYPLANRSSVLGLFAPSRTPASVVERLNGEINQVLAQPEVRRQLLETGNVPTGGSSAAFAQLIAEESAGNARIIRNAHIRLE